ncbi:MAG: VWA domain-containing protein [Opitutae bacterium]|nr:VWA domain-containing protein [Opitutae bacterium]
MPLAAAKEAKDDKSMNVGLPVAPSPSPMVAMDVMSPGEARAAQASGSAAVYPMVQTELMARQSYFGNMKMKAAPAPGLSFGGGAAPVERDHNTEAYGHHKDNDFLRVVDNPLSTFSVDVDTASYANVRRFLAQKQLPPADAVRIEELVNYFPYAYRPPTGSVPFAASLEVASAPWAPGHRLVRIGLKGREVSDAARPAANLVFLLDVSGSMDEPNKLPLVKQSLRLLVNKLRPDDRVAIAVYAGASGLALPSTSAREQAKILEAIEELTPGGSTNGALGIQLAYDIAKAHFIPGGVNRVILATDGDFNVGTTSEGELVRLIEEKAKSGVFLSVLGFGMGNYKDSTLELLADKGKGNYAYIDSLAEAKKTLVEQAGGTLVTIAKDVKIQVEFNPAQVQAYRLIGYENRLLAKEDFNNDKVDAGDIGAGHTVTALYEVVPVGVGMETAPGVDPLKYQRPAGQQESRSSLLAGRDLSGPTARQTEMLTVKIRYKEPAGDVSSKLEFPLTDTGARFEDASPDFKFAAAVAGFGLALRDSPHKGALTLAQVAEWGRAGLGGDVGGYRTEFMTLVGEAASLLR